MKPLSVAAHAGALCAHARGEVGGLPGPRDLSPQFDSLTRAGAGPGQPSCASAAIWWQVLVVSLGPGCAQVSSFKGLHESAHMGASQLQS